MNREFREVPSFTKKWFELGLNDDDLRIPVGSIGKRSGGRVIYVDIEVKECIYLLNVYAKNEKIDLSEKEREMLKKLVKVLKEE